MNRFIKGVFMKEKLQNCINRLKSAFEKERIKAFFADKKKKRRFITISTVLIILIASLIFGVVYVNDYYRADDEAIGAYLSESTSVSSYYLNDKTLVISPTEAKAGLIFYPGGKVEFTSYIPLMTACAERGILCVITEMPLNLAVLDVNAAEGIKDNFPNIDEWYIGGHSLGGSMAASYLSKNTDKIDGLILLGSYSTADVKSSRVLSIYGSNDGVMNREKYQKYKDNLPLDLTEIVIEGGNHAYFGMYGEQKGDGLASITAEEQTELTAEYIADFIFN